MSPEYLKRENSGLKLPDIPYKNAVVRLTTAALVIALGLWSIRKADGSQPVNPTPTSRVQLFFPEVYKGGPLETILTPYPVPSPEEKPITTATATATILIPIPEERPTSTSTATPTILIPIPRPIETPTSTPTPVEPSCPQGFRTTPTGNGEVICVQEPLTPTQVVNTTQIPNPNLTPTLTPNCHVDSFGNTICVGSVVAGTPVINLSPIPSAVATTTVSSTLTFN